MPLPFTQLSLDLGAISRPTAPDHSLTSGTLVPIKPLEPALALLENQDGSSSAPFHVVGSGLAGVEVALALRHRWHRRPIHLLARAIVSTGASPQPCALLTYMSCSIQLALQPPLH